MKPEEAFDRIVGSLSNYNFHNLLREIQTVKNALQKRKRPQKGQGMCADDRPSPIETGIFSDDY